MRKKKFATKDGVHYAMFELSNEEYLNAKKGNKWPEDLAPLIFPKKEVKKVVKEIKEDDDDDDDILDSLVGGNKKRKAVKSKNKDDLLGLNDDADDDDLLGLGKKEEASNDISESYLNELDDDGVKNKDDGIKHESKLNNLGESDSKPWYKKWWAWLIGILLVAVLGYGLSKNGDSDKPAKDDTPKTSQSSSKKATTYKIGSNVHTKSFDLIVTSVGRLSQVGGQYGEKAKGKYVAVNTTFTNNAKEAKILDDSEFTLELNGNKYSSSSDSIYIDGNDTFFENVNPGVKVHGTILFDVPVNIASSDKFVLHFNNGELAKDITINLTK